jgi:hypothetical protein
MPSSSSLKAVSTMKRDELRAELDQRSIMYSSKDTVEELRAHVSQLCQKEKDSQSSEDQEDPMGLTSLKRADLVKKCEEYGVPITSNTTRGEMIYRIKKHLSLTSEPKGEDIFGICQHQGLTYRTIRTQYSDYCQWATTTAAESGGSCHWELARFVRYLNRPLSPVTTGHTRAQAKARATQGVNPTEIEDLKKTVQSLEEKIRVAGKRATDSAGSSTMNIDQTNQIPEGIDAVLRSILQRLENLEVRETQSTQSDSSWSMTPHADS